MDSSNVISRCPTLTTDEWTNIKSLEIEFNLNDNQLSNLQKTIESNPGKTSRELADLFNFYNFQTKEIDLFLKLINTHRHSFHGICGPFIYEKNRWYAVYKQKYMNTAKLAQENSTLRDELERKKQELINMENVMNSSKR